jgi:hypothetical protein
MVVYDFERNDYFTNKIKEYKKIKILYTKLKENSSKDISNNIFNYNDLNKIINIDENDVKLLKDYHFCVEQIEEVNQNKEKVIENLIDLYDNSDLLYSLLNIEDNVFNEEVLKNIYEELLNIDSDYFLKNLYNDDEDDSFEQSTVKVKTHQLLWERLDRWNRKELSNKVNILSTILFEQKFSLFIKFVEKIEEDIHIYYFVFLQRLDKSKILRLMSSDDYRVVSLALFYLHDYYHKKRRFYINKLNRFSCIYNKDEDILEIKSMFKDTLTEYRRDLNNSINNINSLKEYNYILIDYLLLVIKDNISSKNVDTDLANLSLENIVPNLISDLNQKKAKTILKIIESYNRFNFYALLAILMKNEALNKDVKKIFASKLLVILNNLFTKEISEDRSPLYNILGWDYFNQWFIANVSEIIKDIFTLTKNSSEDKVENYYKKKDDKLIYSPAARGIDYGNWLNDNRKLAYLLILFSEVAVADDNKQLAEMIWERYKDFIYEWEWRDVIQPDALTNKIELNLSEHLASLINNFENQIEINDHFAEANSVIDILLFWRKLESKEKYRDEIENLIDNYFKFDLNKLPEWFLEKIMIILLNNGFNDQSLDCLERLRMKQGNIYGRKNDFYEMIDLFNNIVLKDYDYEKELLSLLQRTKNEQVYYNIINHLRENNMLIETEVDMEIFDCITKKLESDNVK